MTTWTGHYDKARYLLEYIQLNFRLQADLCCGYMTRVTIVKFKIYICVLKLISGYLTFGCWIYIEQN